MVVDVDVVELVELEVVDVLVVELVDDAGSVVLVATVVGVEVVDGAVVGAAVVVLSVST